MTFRETQGLLHKSPNTRVAIFLLVTVEVYFVQTCNIRL